MSDTAPTGAPDAAGGNPPAPPAGTPAPPAAPPPPAPPPAGGAPAGTPAPAGKTYTDAEMQAIMAREKDQGGAAAKRALLEELGVQTPEEAKALLESQRELERSKLTEAQQAAADAAADRAAAAREKAEATKERLMASIERALLSAGLGADIAEADDADGKKREALLARAVRLVDVADDADATKVKEAVEALKTDVPSFFGVPAAVSQQPPAANGHKPPAAPPPSSNPVGRTPAAQQGGEDRFAAGVERGKKAAGADTKFDIATLDQSRKASPIPST